MFAHERQGFAIDLGDQYVILMEMKGMVRECSIIHRPFFVVAGDHVGKQGLGRVEQSLLFEVDPWHSFVAGRHAHIVGVAHHLESAERSASPV